MERFKTVNKPELIAALIILFFGFFMVGEGAMYPTGSPRRMGPGFMPIMVGVFLSGLGALLVAQALKAAKEDIRLGLRPILAVGASVLAFAVLATRAGLVPTAFVMVILAAFAEKPARLPTALATAAVMAALGYVVFVRGLAVSLQAFW